MKLFRFAVLSCVVGSAVLAEAKFYAEAGVSYASLQGANLHPDVLLPNPVILLVPGPTPPDSVLASSSQDRSATSPFVALGYSWSGRFGLRISYRYLGNVTARADYKVLVGGDALIGTYSSRFNDDIHVISLAPEFSWPVAANFTLSISPELNWVSNDGEVLSSTTSTLVTVAPRLEHGESDFTFGVSASGEWHWTETSSVVLRYQFADLKPSWERQAHLVTGAIRWRF